MSVVGIIPAGGVHENRGCAELGSDGSVGGVEARFVHRVCSEKLRGSAGSADRIDSSLTALGIATEDGHFGSRGSEALGQGTTQHAGRADYHSHIIRQVEKGNAHVRAENGEAGGEGSKMIHEAGLAHVRGHS